MTQLTGSRKNQTNAIQYNQLFSETINQLKAKSWSCLFTDASKIDHTVSLAVVDDQGQTISAGIAIPPSSVFTAEAIAIQQAAQYAAKMKGKFIICTDSKATLAAVSNASNENSIIAAIRDTLIDNENKIKLMWVPGHVGIAGNELADKRAKLASKQPLHYFPLASKCDINREISSLLNNERLADWQRVNHHYSKINPSGLKPSYPASSSTIEMKVFLRLRIGHLRLTHQHLLTASQAPTCQYCNNGTVSVDHILNKCKHFSQIRQKYFNNINLIELLKTPDIKNLKIIFDFVNKSNLLSSI